MKKNEVISLIYIIIYQRIKKLISGFFKVIKQNQSNITACLLLYKSNKSQEPKNSFEPIFVKFKLVYLHSYQNI